jgi:lysophospholipase L1-like esterase
VLAATPALLGVAGGSSASAAVGDPYVALGDSYASGPAIPVQTLDVPGCLRSTNNYPNVVANAEQYQLKDVSCSGATTNDIFNAQSTSNGTNPPQINAVTPAAKVVTVTIGGNDIGFTGIIENCAAATPNGPTLQTGAPNCKSIYHHSATNDELVNRIAATKPKVAAVLQAIHSNAPGAQVYLVGYPTILPDKGNTGCFPQNPLTTVDVPYLRDVEKNLDAMLSGAAGANGASYVDTYTPTIDHDSCQLPGIRWVEPVVPANSAAPVHPNILGEQAMGQATVKKIG